jgi:hypothetical protein
MKIRILLAAVLGGLTMFLWGGLAHAVLPLGEIGFKAAAPPPGDAPIMQLLTTTLSEDAIYIAPGGDWEKRNDPAVKEEWDKRWNAGPRAYITVDHRPMSGMGAMLGKELVTDVVVALLAALLLSCTSGCCSSFVGRTGFVTGLGLVASLPLVQQWTWMSAPCNHTAAFIAITVIGFAIMGIVIAAIVRPRAAAP